MGIGQAATTKVTVFVDWNSQIHNSETKTVSEVDTARLTLKYTGRNIGKILTRVDKTRRFDVSLRLYHGWHKGFEVTARKRALVEVSNELNFSGSSDFRNVLIRPTLEYGDRLISALSGRIHARLGIHLPNTWRTQERGSRTEKMVDTAIASDVVALAHQEPDRWLLVIGEDDDLVPPMFVAEGVRGVSQGRVLLSRKRQSGPFLKLDDLLIKG